MTVHPEAGHRAIFAMVYIWTGIPPDKMRLWFSNKSPGVQHPNGIAVFEGDKVLADYWWGKWRFHFYA